MKRFALLFLSLLLLFQLFPVSAFADAAVPEDAEQVAAVILHTNDAHVAFEDNIGYDGLALYKKELEAVYDHVLLIDAGDAIQGAPIGSVSKGAEIIRMMNRLGYDLAVPGNHEFDYGLEALDDCAEALDCGYTCANFCVTVNGMGHDNLNAEEIAYWSQTYQVPMGANLQFVFYRSNKKPAVLFKVLLNGEEARLPLETDSWPYYDWAAFKARYGR